MSDNNYQNNGLDLDENATTVLTEEDMNFARGNYSNQPQNQNDPYSNPEYVESQPQPQPQQQAQQQIPQPQKVKTQKPPKNPYGKKSKKWLIILISVGAALLVGAGLFFGVWYLPKNIKYNKAVAEFKDEKYSDAIDDFKKIEGFKDSKEKIYYCYTMSGDELDQEQKYNLAKAQYEKSLKYAQDDEQKKKSKEKVETLGHKEMFKKAYDACQGSSCVELSIDGLQISVSLKSEALKESVACLSLVIDNLKIEENDNGNMLTEAFAAMKQGQEYNKKIGDINVKATNSSISGTQFIFSAD